jgi:hypothetical protein
MNLPMRKIQYLLVIFSLLLLSHSTYAQEELRISGLGTTFVVIGSIADKVKEGRCPCSVPRKEKCSLYEFKIQKVLNYFDNNVFSMDELIRVDKILISNKVNLEKGREYVICLQPGTSKLYIQYTDTLSINPGLSYKIIHKDGYITDLISCKGQRDRFNEFLLSKQID